MASVQIYSKIEYYAKLRSLLKEGLSLDLNSDERAQLFIISEQLNSLSKNAIIARIEGIVKVVAERRFQ